MMMRAWTTIVATIIYISLVGNSWAQESRPAKVKPIDISAVPKISPEESEQRLQDAMVLFERGKTDAAIHMLQQLEKADPSNYKLLFKLGEIAIDAKNWAYAIEVLRKVSFLRPKDIEVRLILMDIYKAYQMPIQAIIVGKEIIALDPDHVDASRRLAELYQEQSMHQDEIHIRQQLKRLVPEDYNNLSRLAAIFDGEAQLWIDADTPLWESAKVYEQIRIYYPNKLDDMKRLAAIYDTLGESFREAEILDHIAARSWGRGWMPSNAETNLRKQNEIYDPFRAGVMFKAEQEPTMNIYTVQPRVSYTRLRIRSSIDFGVVADYALLNHHGVDLLDGTMNINSTSVALSAIKNWGLDYVLAASAGFRYDDVSGRLFARDGNPAVSADDFPFLADPTFNSYGGIIPIGTVQFLARPGLDMTYSVNYEHGLVEDLSARLSLFTHDILSLGIRYESNDRTLLELRVDNGFISDGNYRFHGKAAGYYDIWASGAMYDFRNNRYGYFHKLPEYFVRLGYEFDYFNDHREAEDDKYETFVSPEYRHTGVLLGQALVMNLGPEEQLLFNVKLSYGVGTTLPYRGRAEARLFYFNPDSENEFGLSYAYQDEDSTNVTQSNLQIGGRTTTHIVNLFMNWRF